MAEKLRGKIIRIEKDGDKRYLITRDDKEKMPGVPVKDLNIIKIMNQMKDINSVSIEFELKSGQPNQQTITFLESEKIADAREKAKQLDEKIQENIKEFEDNFEEIKVTPKQQPKLINTNYQRDFHNPYNFVPAISREILTGELGDNPPSGHDRYISDKFSGRLTVEMTVKTPLILLNTAQVLISETEHKKFPVRVGTDEKPEINPTAVKGMLRSAYEVITNSRMSVFTKHEDRLAFRREAKSPIPVRIEEKNGEFFAKLLEYQKIDKKVMNGVAKLQRYSKHSSDIDKGEDSYALRYSSGDLPKHGEPVFVKYQKIKAGAEVQEIKRRQEGEESKGDWVAGWACINGANINGKRFERVFLDMLNAISIPVDKNLWEELVRNYQETHKKELEKREKNNQRPSDYLGDKPGQTAWSRHIHNEYDLKLENGTLCYAEIENGAIKSLFPVMISRQLFECSPAELLNDSLKPAFDIEKLSPADRVFGCVIQNPMDKKKANAYRGQVRFSEIICKTGKDNSIQFFDDLPLNILGQPKPQQGRFYVAEDDSGKSQIYQQNNENAGYKTGRGLRGRKVYPHHAHIEESQFNEFWFVDKKTEFKDDSNDYWKEAFTNSNGKTSFREYLRPRNYNKDKREVTQQRDSQNRSIQGWVKPETEFQFDIHFTNLSEIELGGLVWLLSMNGESENQYFHRFGGGKPLGFGSVKLEISGEGDVRKGEDWLEFYSSLDDQGKGKLDNVELAKLATGFESLINTTYPTILEAFKVACKGFADKLPIHYPRARNYREKPEWNQQKRKNEIVGIKDLDPIPLQPNPDGKSFEWFVENAKAKIGLKDREGKVLIEEIEARFVLDDLWKDEKEDSGLPILPHKKT